jgi:amino acid transporter
VDRPSRELHDKKAFKTGLEIWQPSAGSDSNALLSPHQLCPNTISQIGLIALAVGMISPALGVYALWAPIQATTGPIAPLVFLAAMTVALPTAVSYAKLNSVAPSAAAAATWLTNAGYPGAGCFIGLCMATYFLIAVIVQPILFGLFFSDLLRFLGISTLTSPHVLEGAALVTVIAMMATYSGARASTRMSIALMTVEVVVVTALALTIVNVQARNIDGLNVAAFNPTSATAGLHGFLNALLLGILGFAGFDVVSAAAEETHTPKEAVPRAILITVLAIGIFWALVSWSFTLSMPDEAVRQYSRGGLTAVTPMAKLYWGHGNILVILTALAGCAAVYVPSALGASRILFALARYGWLPSALLRANQTGTVPLNAMHFVYAVAVAAVTISVTVFGNAIEAFVWWSNALVFFLAITFTGVNIAAYLFFGKRDSNRSVWSGRIIPILGVMINVYVLICAFFGTLLQQPWKVGKSIVALCLLVSFCQILYSLRVVYRR